MAFVCSGALTSSFLTSNVPAKNRLPQRVARAYEPCKISMDMSGVFRDFLKSSSKDYASGSYSKPSVSRATPAFFPTRAPAPSQDLDGAKDTVKPRTAGKADIYMADKSIVPQYKAVANSTGVYDPSCTEGAARLQAEQSRELANLNNFRMLQRPIAAKYFDFYETRKMATSMAHGCTYEEKLLANFPLVCRAMVRGYSEAKSLCVRYNNTNSPEEQYMASCVDNQYKANAVSGGVYGVQCCDGNTGGLAEFKRVQALSARFRANQMTDLKKEQAKFDARKFARTMFRTCNYEEDVYNAYPAVASSMRPLTARY